MSDILSGMNSKRLLKDARNANDYRPFRNLNPYDNRNMNYEELGVNAANRILPGLEP
jgi:hypothetical protein